MNAWPDLLILAVFSAATVTLCRWWGVRDDLRDARDRQWARQHRIKGEQ